MQDSPSPPRTCEVIGSRLAITDYAAAIALAQSWAARRDSPRSIAAAATHLITLARRDPKFGEAVTTLDLLMPDGMPIVWCMNKMCNAQLKDRVYGPTFMIRCI